MSAVRADAAGRAAFFPARAAARAWRGPSRRSSTRFCRRPRSRASSTERSQVRSRRSSRSLVRHRVLERIGRELAASGELERLVNAALASRRRSSSPTRCSRATRPSARWVMSRSSPELRTRSPARRRGSPRRSSAACEPRPCGSTIEPSRSAPQTAGHAVALRRDRDPRDRTRDGRGRDDRHLHVGRRRGRARVVPRRGLRPEWLVGVLLGSGWMLVVGTYFVLFWSGAGQTPGMRLLHLRLHGPSGSALSVGRSFVRFSGSCSRSCRCSPASFPCSSLERATRPPDFLAGTVVLYDDAHARPLRVDRGRDSLAGSAD